MRRGLVVLLCVVGLAVPAAANAGWPGFRGPNFDGALPDVRLFDGDAVTLVPTWKVPLGSGYSALAVGDGRVAAMFAESDGDYLAAFDVETGEQLWRYRIADPYKGHDGSHDGPISTPVMHGGRIFGLGAAGQLFAVDAATGHEIWTTHLVDDVGADAPFYGFTSSPRVVDGVLLVASSQIKSDDAQAPAEGAEGNTKPPKPARAMAIAGFDLETGKALWIAGDDHIEYHSPTVATLAGQRQVLLAGKTNLYGLDARTGTILWSHAHGGDDRAMGGLTIVPLTAGDDRVFLMNKIDSSVMLQVQLKKKGWEIAELWSSGSIARSYVPPVYHSGYIYGMNNRIFTCVDAATGEVAWRSREPGDGFPTLVGEQLVVITKPGSLHVIDASSTGYRERARLDLFEEHSWSEVAYADGHLFARSMAHLARVDLRSDASRIAAGERPWFADTLLGRFLTTLNGVTGVAERATAIDNFLAAHPASPIVENDGTLHFLYRGKAQDVGIVGDTIGFRREDPMTRVPETDLFHYTTRLEPNAAATYGFIVDYDKPIPDPRNSRKATGLFGDVSWFAMPAWRAPAYLTDAEPARQGRLEVLEWTSPAPPAPPAAAKGQEAAKAEEGRKRKVEIYLPAGYDRDDRRYPVLYVRSGDKALEQGRMKQLLDQSIGSRVAPLIAAFIHGDPEGTRPESAEAYGKMVIEELLPKIDAKYRTLAEARSRATVGFGGDADGAVVLAFEHPEVFGRVGAQSAMMGKDEIPDLAERGADQRPLVIYLDWGTYHMRSPHEAWSLVDSNRELWAALRAAGYRPAGGERPEGFGWPIWAAHTDQLLAALFPMVPMGTGTETRVSGTVTAGENDR